MVVDAVLSTIELNMLSDSDTGSLRVENDCDTYNLSIQSLHPEYVPCTLPPRRDV